MSDPRPAQASSRRLLAWIVTSGLASMIVGFAAGSLAWIGGGSLALAMLTGGAACGGAMNLAVAVIKLVGRASKRSTPEA